MHLTTLKRSLHTDRTGYTDRSITDYVSTSQLRLKAPAVTFSRIKAAFQNASTRSIGFEPITDRTRCLGHGVDDTIERLWIVATLAHDDMEIVERIGKSIERVESDSVPFRMRTLAIELTRIHRMFVRNGVVIGDHEESVGPVIATPVAIGETRIYPYIRYAGMTKAGNMGEYYPGIEDCEPFVMLDVSKAVGLAVHMVTAMDDSYERAGSMRSTDINRTVLQWIKGDPRRVYEFYNSVMGVIGGRLWHQTIMECADNDPEKWFMNIINAQLQTIAVHEKVHHLLERLNFPEVMDEALAMLGQIAYGTGTMGLAMIFVFNRERNNKHSTAAREVVRSLLQKNEIDKLDVNTLPALFDLNSAELKVDAAAILDYHCLSATGKTFADLTSEREMRMAVTTAYVTDAQLPLMYAIRHNRN